MDPNWGRSLRLESLSVEKFNTTEGKENPDKILDPAELNSLK